jgi:hypothetical protein
MKKLHTLLLGMAAFAAALSTNAQVLSLQVRNRVKVHDQRIHANAMRLLRHQNALTESGKKTRSASRLIAEAYAMPGTSDRDTVRHFYSSMAYGFDPTTTLFWGFEPGLFVSIFEQYTGLINNAPDLSVTWLNNGTLTVTDSTRYTFDANHRCLSDEFFDVAFNSRTKTVYTYGPNNLITSMIDSNYDGATLTEVNRMLMTYTAQNRLQTLQQDTLNLSNSTWGTTMLDSMFYDAGNRLSRLNMYNYNVANSQWEPMYGYRYTYNAANKVVVDTAAFWNSGSWMDVGIDNHLYDASNRRLSITRRSFAGMGWDLQERDSMEYAGANPYPHTVLKQNYNMGWEWTQRNRYSYNAGYQVTVDSAFSYNMMSASWTPSDVNWYYYETYNPSSVGNQPELNAEVSLYPVPVQEQLNVTFKREDDAPMNWQIRAADGRVLQQGETGAQSSGHIRVSLLGMPAGLYLFALQGAEGSMIRRFEKE